MYIIALLDNLFAETPEVLRRFSMPTFEDAFRAASLIDVDSDFPNAVALVLNPDGRETIRVPKFYFRPDEDEAYA